MTQKIILANARLVLAQDVLDGQIVIENGEIVDIDSGTGVPAGAVDCAGDFLAPGLVELHTDNLERHLAPRPKVAWPHRAAILAHDRELAGCGITTVFDALRVGSIVSGEGRNYDRYARPLADEILGLRAQGALKISHHLHLRAEICSETLLSELDEFGPEDRVGIVSLMDHTPGQRQFADVSKFEDYLRGKYGMSRAEFEGYLVFLSDLQTRLGETHELGAVAAARRYGAALASHDDTTAGQVAVSRGHGVRLAEFPTTAEAATACRTAGIAVMMGAPNLVRGGSHSGNVAAADLAQQECLDILSSDYVPSALLLGAVQLGDIWGNLARGIATVSDAPARAVGLADRGRIEIGARADLLRMALRDGAPEIHGVWSAGRRVA